MHTDVLFQCVLLIFAFSSNILTLQNTSRDVGKVVVLLDEPFPCWLDDVFVALLNALGREIDRFCVRNVLHAGHD